MDAMDNMPLELLRRIAKLVPRMTYVCQQFSGLLTQDDKFLIALQKYPAHVVHRRIPEALLAPLLDFIANMTVSEYCRERPRISLHHAAGYGNFLLCDHLSQGATLKDLDRALTCASTGGRFDVCKFLIDRGANDLDEALVCAGHLDVCTLLIERGAEDFDAALLKGAWEGHVDVCNLLIERGATELDEALLGAAHEGRLDVCKLLVEGGATALDEALRGAAHYGRLYVFEWIVSHGATPPGIARAARAARHRHPAVRAFLLGKLRGGSQRLAEKNGVKKAWRRVGARA